MIAPLILIFAAAGGDYVTENDAVGVQAPFDERAGGTLNLPTIAKSAADRLDPLDAGDLKTLGKHVGEVKAVRGTCTAAFVPRGGTVVVLNFAKNYREAMTVPIFKDHFEKWPGGPGAIEKAYKGKTLLIQGLVTEYRGAPQIKAAHPAQLRLIE